MLAAIGMTLPMAWTDDAKYMTMGDEMFCTHSHGTSGMRNDALFMPRPCSTQECGPSCPFMDAEKHPIEALIALLKEAGFTHKYEVYPLAGRPRQMGTKTIQAQKKGIAVAHLADVFRRAIPYSLTMQALQGDVRARISLNGVDTDVAIALDHVERLEFAPLPPAVVEFFTTFGNAADAQFAAQQIEADWFDGDPMPLSRALLEDLNLPPEEAARVAFACEEQLRRMCEYCIVSVYPTDHVPAPRLYVDIQATVFP